MLSSDESGDRSVTPADDPTRSSGSNALAGSLIVLLAGALVMVAVARTGPQSRDLPLLPPIDGTGEEAELSSLASTEPPGSLAPGVVAPTGEAPAYRLNAATSREIVTALTVALGMTAGSDSRSNDRNFLVTDRGSDRVLLVEKAAGHPWTLNRGDPECIGRPDSVVSSDGTVSCPASGVGTSGSGQTSGSTGSGGSAGSDSGGTSGSEEARCPPVECPEGEVCAQVCPEPAPVTRPFPFESDEPSFELPDPQRAESRTREVLNAMGLEVARTTLSAAADGSSWQVLAEVSVGGIAAVGMETHLSIGEDTEIVAGTGMVPDVELLGRYPLIGAADALSRLQRTVVAQPGGPEPAVAPAPGEFEPMGRPTVTGIRLVLLLQAGNVEQLAGDYLVPAFLVDASDGSIFTVPAVPDEHLARPEPGRGDDAESSGAQPLYD